MTIGQIAIQTLCADRSKLLAAVVGVVFSVVLVNIQVGLYLGLIGKASLLVDNSQAHIWVGHKRMHNVDFARDIPRRWLHRVRAAHGVIRVEPYLVGFSEMTLPSGGYESVVVVGVEENASLGRPWNLDMSEWRGASRCHALIVDACDGDKLEEPQLGETREIGRQRVRVVGHTEGILGFLVTPYVFTSYRQATSLLQKDPRSCSYLLVATEPGENVEAVAAEIQECLPEADVYPAPAFSRLSRQYWVTRTGIGVSFGAATSLGLLVGLVMVAQTLHSLVLDRKSEFAALKAIGASEWQLLSLLGVQALFMALVGSLVGLGVVMSIQYGVSTPRAPIETPWWLTSGSVVLVTVICLAAAIAPYLRMRRIDPLCVLQGG